MAGSPSKTSQWVQFRPSRQHRRSGTVRFSNLTGLSSASGLLSMSMGEEFSRLYLVLESDVANVRLLAGQTVVVKLFYTDEAGGQREFFHATYRAPAVGEVIEAAIEAPAPPQGMIGQVDMSVEQFGSTLSLKSVLATLGWLPRDEQ